MSQRILDLFTNKKNHHLRSAEGRNKIALRIQEVTNYYSHSEILSFVEEMRGLNLQKSDDRQLFIKFLECWLPLEDQS